MSGFIILVVTFSITLFLGLPIALAIGVSSLMPILFEKTVNLSILPQAAYTTLESFPLIAIPLFILASAIMEHGGLTKRIVQFSEVVFSGNRGGLGSTVILASALFAALTGSGPATAAAIGGVLIPSMIKKGYDKGYSAAIVACSGGLGIVIPPSIPMIIYGITAEVSIGTLFVAGIIPGILLACFLFLINYFLCRKYIVKEVLKEKIHSKNIIKAIFQAKWALLVPVIILGGIYAGVVTVTEASVIAVLYALLVSIFIYKEITFKNIKQSLKFTLNMTGVVLFALTVAGVFAKLVMIYQIPVLVGDIIYSISNNLMIVISMIIGIFIVTGMFMETLTQIIVLTPIFLPIVTQLGMDPIQYGILVVIGCEIGFQTPPVGINLFITQKIAGVSFEKVSKRSTIFTIAEISVLMLTAIFPQITLFLPKLLGFI